MMKMKKLLATVLATAFLAGCASSNTPPASTPTGQPNQTGSEASAGTSDPEPVTLSIVNKDMSPDDPALVEFFERVSEGMKPLGYNLSFKIEAVQSGTYSEKLGLLLQSGTIPDIIYFQGGDYQFAITQGILEDLTPYVDASPIVQASMNEFNKQRFENYPYLLWLASTITPVAVVREDFFNNAPSSSTFLSDPSIDNYYTLMKELKENNGTKSAYTVGGSLSELDTIFDQAFGNTATWLKNSDGTYVYNRVSETEKNKLDFYAKLYKDGLLDNEYLTKAWDTKEKAFYDGDAAIIAGTQGKVIDLYNTKTISQNGESANIMVLPPAKGEGQGYNPIDVSKEGRGYAISALSEHKKEAFAVFEFLATPEGQVIDKLGVEGVQYEMVDGKVKLLPGFSEWYEKLWGTTLNFKTEFDPSTPFLSKPGVDSLDYVLQYGTADNLFILPSDLSGKMDAAKAVYLEYATDVVTGKITTADFDKYVQQFMDNGGREVTEYANEILK